MRVGSLITMFPSRSNNGLQALDDGSYTVFSLLRNFLAFFVTAVDCPLTTARVLHLSELGLSLLFYRVVTIFLWMGVFVVYILDVS